MRYTQWRTRGEWRLRMVAHLASPLDQADSRTRCADFETTSILFGRASIALVWLYQGLVNKLLGGDPDHAAIVDALPGIGPARGRLLLSLIGLFETCLAL